LSANKSERRAALKKLSAEERTMIFHEAPHKLKATLADMSAAFGGERRIALCRELTKLNEEAHRTTLDGAVEHYEQNEPRGEYVLVVEGAPESTSKEDWSNMSVEEHVESYIAAGMSKMDAIKAVAKDRGVPKNVIYKEFI
jgi:16S rRNA (cytidine1402-2'-O)-methyltransferase